MEDLRDEKFKDWVAEKEAEIERIKNEINIGKDLFAHLFKQEVSLTVVQKDKTEDSNKTEKNNTEDKPSRNVAVLKILLDQKGYIKQSAILAIANGMGYSFKSGNISSSLRQLIDQGKVKKGTGRGMYKAIRIGESEV